MNLLLMSKLEKLDKDNMNINPNYRDGYNSALDALSLLSIDEEKLKDFLIDKLKPTGDASEIIGTYTLFAKAILTALPGLIKEAK